MAPYADAQSRYLDARVATASQPELQLMLLDGALRFGRQAEQLWDVADQRSECARLLGRTIDIVEELVRGVAGGATPQSQRLEEEYAFAFRQLALAQLNRDAKSLRHALDVISFHRETWKLACEGLRTDSAAPLPPPPLAPTALPSGPSFSLQA